MEKETAKGKVEKTLGNAKEAAGHVTGDDKLASEGVADQAKGHLHETVGAVKHAGKEIAAGIKDGTDSARKKESGKV